jgi:hypothetical protein
VRFQVRVATGLALIVPLTRFAPPTQIGKASFLRAQSILHLGFESIELIRSYFGIFSVPGLLNSLSAALADFKHGV